MSCVIVSSLDKRISILTVEPNILADLLTDSSSEKVDVAKSEFAESVYWISLTKINQILIIDSRSFVDFNAGHIKESIHLPSSNLMKRRLQQDKIMVPDLLHLQPGFIEQVREIIVYDESSHNFEAVDRDSFLFLTVQKLSKQGKTISFLRGGFKNFHTSYPSLCVQQEDQPLLLVLSQPNMPSLDCGPTKIFPHLYLGSEQDALSIDLLKSKGIEYVLNVSQSCPKAEFIPDSNFMRIPVNDTYSDKLICHFIKAFQFLEKVKSANGCALVHCMAGVSRSPTLAIAYVMSHLMVPYDEAYRYVKEKRPSISPNFNFLGQLLEFDRRMKEQRSCGDSNKHQLSPTSSLQACSKRQRLVSIRSSSKNTLNLNLAIASGPTGGFDKEEISPSAVIKRLSLGPE